MPLINHTDMAQFSGSLFILQTMIRDMKAQIAMQGHLVAGEAIDLTTARSQAARLWDIANDLNAIGDDWVLSILGVGVKS